MLDEKDESIIRVLGRRAGLSSRALSKMLGMPISTVHRRIKKLEQEGIILGYKALIDFEKTTWPIAALLFLNLSETIPGKGHIPKSNILNSLRGFKEIEEVTEVQAADFDLLVKARFKSLRKMSEIMEDLRSIEGIEETSSAIIIEETFLPPSILID